MKATPAGKKAFKYTYRNAQARQRWLPVG